MPFNSIYPCFQPRDENGSMLGHVGKIERQGLETVTQLVTLFSPLQAY